MMRAAAFLILVAILSAVGFLYGVLTPDQRAREVAGWFGGGAEEPRFTSVREELRPEAPVDPPPESAPARPAEPATPAAPPSEAVPADLPERVRQLLATASAGDSAAQFELATVYDHGDGVPEDNAAAVLWYTRAAEQGHVSAQNDLGYMYQNGYGVDADMDRAIAWYTRAGEQGLALAQHNLGLIYENGTGTPRDNAEAARWYRLAAEQGHHRAQHTLATMYQYGRGVAADAGEALEWYARAAEDGRAESNNSLAWFLATSTNDRLRNGARAITAAEVAVGLEPTSASYVDTLAAAYAEAGRFDEAVRTQMRAISMLETSGQAEAVPDYESRLTLYRNGEPARY